MNQLDDFIARLTKVINSENKSIYLHWSDVELLKQLAEEKKDTERKLQNLSKAVDELLKK